MLIAQILTLESARQSDFYMLNASTTAFQLMVANIAVTLAITIAGVVISGFTAWVFASLAERFYIHNAVISTPFRSAIAGAIIAGLLFSFQVSVCLLFVTVY